MNTGLLELEECHIDLDRVSGLADKLEVPKDYFVGKDWGGLVLPREILCFLRARQSDEDGWAKMSATSKRYDQHQRFVLLVVLEGDGRVGLETDFWDFEKGNALLMFPHQAHYYSRLPNRFQWLFITFELPVEFWGQLADLRESPRTISPQNLSKLAQFLSVWSQAEDEGAALKSSSQLGEILTSLCADPLIASLGSESDLVQSVRRQVSENLKSDLSVKALSAHFGVSGSYLREQFRDGAGVSLGHFVRSVRLMQATKLLRESSTSVRKVAEECGFGSFTAFSRAFGQVYGHSPSVYRRQGASLSTRSR